MASGVVGNFHGVEIVGASGGTNFHVVEIILASGGSTGLKCGPRGDEKNNRVDVFDLPRVGRNLHGVEIVCPRKGKFTRGGNCMPRVDLHAVEI